MQIIVLRPSVDGDSKLKYLAECFKNMVLVDKTVCEDLIVYIFANK